MNYRTIGFDWEPAYFAPYSQRHEDTAMQLKDMHRAWTEVAATNRKYTRHAIGLIACQIDAKAGDLDAKSLLAKYQAERDALLAQRVVNRLTGGKK